MNLKLNIIVLFLVLGTFQLFAQETRGDIEKQADSYFQKEQFIEATPLYLRLLSLEPRNPSYNYRYGTCLLFNSDEKKSAFKYLNYAVQKGKQVDDEAYFYLGKAYHLTFQFDKAIKYYKIYKDKAGSRAVAKLNVDRQIQMCKNGKSLLANINDVIVLNKTKINKNSFFRIYNLKHIGGEILVTAEFQTKQDKRNDHIPIIHFPSNSNRIYYSSYGDGDNKDIYVRTRLPNGKWSLAQPVFGKVNTSYDEDYPYMDPQHEYLYFSSKGHNSMGGYDIFRSRYNSETNSFEEPENMDIPICSPDNDFLYIVDSLGRNAYFASQRESKSDKIDVYNIRVERIPVHMVILKGQFTSTLHPSEKSLSIHINNNSGTPIGDFETSASGDYLVVLPKGGKYEFTMKVGDKDKEYKQFVEVPYLEKIKPLKQKIVQTTKDDSSIVIIQNLFDESLENSSSIIAEALEVKSKLEVNKKQFDIDSLDQLREQKMAMDKIGLSDFTNAEILGLAQNKLKQLSDRNESINSLIDKAKTKLIQSNEELESHLIMADSLMKQAKNSDNKEDAAKASRQAQNEIQKAKEIQDETQETKSVLDSLFVNKEKNEQQLNEAKQLNEDLKNYDSENEEALSSVLGQHQEFVKNKLLKEVTTDAGADYIAQIDKQLGNQEELLEHQTKLKEDGLNTQKEVDRLKEEYENTNRKGKRRDINLELAKTKSQLESINNELDYVKKQLKKQEALKSKRKMVAKIEAGDIAKNLPGRKEIDQKSNELVKNREKIEDENHEFAVENGIDLSKESDAQPETQPEEDNEKTIQTLTSAELMQKVDPEYERDIEKLNTEVEAGEKSKKDVVKRIRKAIIQVDDVTTSMEKKKEIYPEVKQLDENIKRLSQLKNELTQRIEDINQEIEQENQLANVQEDEAEKERQENIDKTEERNQPIESEEPEKTNNEISDDSQDVISNDIAEDNSNEEMDSTSPSHEEESNEQGINNENPIHEDVQETNHQEDIDKAEDRNQPIESEEPEKSNNEISDDSQDAISDDISGDNSNEDTGIEEEAVENRDSSTPKHKEETNEQENNVVNENSIAEEVNNNSAKEEEEEDGEKQHSEAGTPKIEVGDIQSEKGGKPNEKPYLYAANEKQKEEIKDLNESKNQLLEEEKKNPKIADKKGHQKKLAKVEEQIVQEKSNVLDTAIESLKTNSTPKKSLNNEKEKVNLPLLNAQYSKIEIDDLIQKAKSEKDPRKQRELFKKAGNKQQESLARIEQQKRNTEINQQIDSIISTNDYTNIDPNNVTVTNEDIREEQNELGAQLLDIKSQINEIKSSLPSAKRKEKERLMQKKKELEEIQEKIETKQRQNQEQVSKSDQEKIAINNKGIDVEAINNELSYKDEVSIAQSETYKDLFKSSNQLNQTQYELQVKEEQLNSEKDELKQLRSMKRASAPLSDKDKNGLEKQLIKINKTKGDISNLKVEIKTQQNNIKSFISEDVEQQERIENMIARDVAPLNEIPILPVRTTGLVINNDLKTQYSDNNPIPLSKEQPKGLIFRVQIGAFSKPVPNNTFAEFSPITGDEVRPGLVRYMAGFFGERDNANAARDKIRTMGYADAFVVAYCDGERIPVYRAMQLIKTGACVPTVKTSKNAIVSGNETPGNRGGTFEEELDDYSYNKGTNAAKADVAEAKMGLYYTVQVGVYNTPVSAAQLKNISPLITKRLSNGQIRYSSGIFNSIVEAKPKQSDAINRGITDAFITAYYQGKRIPLGQAKEIREGKGEEVLELKNPTVTRRNKIVNRSSPDNFNEEKEPFLTNNKVQSMLVSKLSFPSYPMQVLNRYNADGQLFYYDSITKHVKSFVFEGSYAEAPFKDDFESNAFYNNVYPILNKEGIRRKDAIKEYEKNTIVLKVEITADDLNPDLMQTILNAPLNKTMTTSKEKIKVEFYAIQSAEGEALINHLQVLLAQFGATDILKSIRQFDEK